MLILTMVRRTATSLSFASFLLLTLVSFSAAQTIRVDMTTGHSTNSFVPNQALGAGIDRMSSASVEKL